ncbi:MAG: hypothetical protein HUU27_01975 [Phycisphaerae bacterium]|nr:hypothetical protein [Phycisphaerae bacterium]
MVLRVESEVSGHSGVAMITAAAERGQVAPMSRSLGFLVAALLAVPSLSSGDELRCPVRSDGYPRVDVVQLDADLCLVTISGEPDAKGFVEWVSVTVPANATCPVTALVDGEVVSVQPRPGKTWRTVSSCADLWHPWFVAQAEQLLEAIRNWFSEQQNFGF